MIVLKPRIGNLEQSSSFLEVVIGQGFFFVYETVCPLWHAFWWGGILMMTMTKTFSTTVYFFFSDRFPDGERNICKPSLVVEWHLYCLC
mmetsp:Transcript_1449/g.1992  ORF Transcript_1449/g.1992 Transcript_1449/m.1992 type:complete len:89 (-) Transcript_1449:653-919(-)